MTRQNELSTFFYFVYGALTCLIVKVALE